MVTDNVTRLHGNNASDQQPETFPPGTQQLLTVVAHALKGATALLHRRNGDDTDNAFAMLEILHTRIEFNADQSRSSPMVHEV